MSDLPLFRKPLLNSFNFDPNKGLLTLQLITKDFDRVAEAIEFHKKSKEYARSNISYSPNHDGGVITIQNDYIDSLALDASRLLRMRVVLYSGKTPTPSGTPTIYADDFLASLSQFDAIFNRLYASASQSGKVNIQRIAEEGRQSYAGFPNAGG